MEKITIYHNKKCGTSRHVLEMIQARGYDPEVVFYLETPLTRAKLKSLIQAMQITPRTLLRKKEALYRELGLDEEIVSDEKIIDAMLQYPVLIERPIVTTALGTRLCRPPEAVLEILPGK